MWVNWHVASNSLADGSLMALTRLLSFATQVLRLALLACQPYTDFWQTPTIVKRSKERAHTHSVGTHPCPQWALQLSQTHCYRCLLVPESLSYSWPLFETCKKAILVSLLMHKFSLEIMCSFMQYLLRTEELKLRNLKTVFFLPYPKWSASTAKIKIHLK